MFAAGARVAIPKCDVKRPKVPKATRPSQLPGNRFDDDPVEAVDRKNALPGRARSAPPRVDTDAALTDELYAYLQTRMMASRISVQAMATAQKYAEAFFKIDHPGIDYEQRARVMARVLPDVWATRSIHHALHSRQTSDGIQHIRTPNEVDPVLRVQDLNNIMGGAYLVEPTLGDRVAATTSFISGLSLGPSLGVGLYGLGSLAGYISRRAELFLKAAAVGAAIIMPVKSLPQLRRNYRADLNTVRQVVPEL